MPENVQVGETAPIELQAFDRIDAVTLEAKYGVRAGRGDSAMKHVPKPLLKGWRRSVHWKLIDGMVYLSSALAPQLRERIRAIQTSRGKTVEQVMDTCRRRELADERAGRRPKGLRVSSKGTRKTPRRRTRTGPVYVPIKDRS